ncbi:MAG: hypothetical protein A2909_00065 [Candidatus Tagabacteria bacterium RIFCSPLOWO2_01_FULL_39_11]|uniref:Peptidoglycan binding-like domain-containing protein n=1 Tax=Candidatus Tagabacteria bacterium RIFCSPLOWO2_01_FULL_39_11 TaxID=1802295 RepID=A0A1G2LV84_9BACT|nr:MAG: hypothetical protein A2909_00065 [Candidatus Tagabacteria bacterium RIFCSPLOWO2_01_FULL_39_11]
MKKIKYLYFITVFVLFAGFASLIPQKARADFCDVNKLSYAQFGQRSERVKTAQICLIQLGFDIPYGPTGYFGKQTSTAVKQFYLNILNMDWSSTFGPKGITALKKVVASKTFSKVGDIQKFSSKEEFRYYLAKSQESSALSLRNRAEDFMPSLAPATLEMGVGGEVQQKAAERVSETNVQVAGIDEPDIIKTDGTRIFFSSEEQYYRMMKEEPLELLMPEVWDPLPTAKTKIIKAFPPAELALENNIDKSGEMLLVKNKKILAIIGSAEINGYDLSDPKNPKNKWTLKFEDNNYLLTSRLFNDKIYLVMKQSIRRTDPCPIKPLSLGGMPITIECFDIYHPVRPVPVDSSFSAIVLNPETGAIENKISFIGSSSDSVVYMSKNNLYITYFYQEGYFRIFADALENKMKDLFPSDVIQSIVRLKDYNISENAKLVEIETILERYNNSLTNDERLRLENETEKRFQDYYEERKRETEKTGIVKINLQDFKILANGTSPGYPLNQFSLDEYNDYLRIAVTVGERSLGPVKSANDVYVLDKDLKIVGAVKDMGLTERIYSARFIGNKGYLVTFRQKDPFYVLDLSDPQNPELKGELKIPGYSSYLEPISDNMILGVGQEENQVKVSLFDVSSPENPVEKDKYDLKDYWSEVMTNHRAFLRDDKHQIFFLPGGQGGYVFSYKDDKLSLTKTVSDFAVKRAVYLDDYLYILSANKIVIFNEINWEKVKELDL